MMNRHYSSSALVKWLRTKVFKIKKPVALGFGEWDDWYNTLKKESPFGYFMTETLPDMLESIPKTFIDPFHNIRYYIHNRWRTKTHAMTSKLEKGKWHEFETRLLHSMFDAYIDFIEIETAHHSMMWNSDDVKKYKGPSFLNRWFDIGEWRCPEAGVDSIKWEQSLVWNENEVGPDSSVVNTRTNQAIAADEKLALYTWWKEIRPTRGDSWEASGFRAFWESMDEKYGHNQWLGVFGKNQMTKSEQKTYNRLSKVKDKLEESWDKEDTEMMIRLIKLRQSLWT